MRFDLIDLRLFLHTLETGSITQGAARSNMSLPSASARLRGMEEMIGLPLLERGRRGVESTPAGDTLAHHARLVLGQMDRMQGELKEHSSGRAASIRVWANTAAVTEFLPRALSPFLRMHPNIQIDLKERLSAETVKAVLADAAEVGIVSDAVDHGALHAFPFATDRLVLVVNPDDALAAQRRVSLRDVLGYSFIGLSPGSPLQEYLCERAVLEGKPLRFRARVRTFDAICSMVEGGAGVGIVPVTAARRYRGKVGLRRIALTDPWATRRLLVCVRDEATLSRPAKALVEHLAGKQDD
jgi:DNA-binding transcriptional LysR family regulator